MDSTQSLNHRDAGPLRGELVRVRSREEILRTVDAAGDRESLPFMPEMLQFAGREMRIHARADKTCNTVDLTGTTLQLSNTVHLAGARCDGSAHGGCHAGCLLFWREEWLERPDGTPLRPVAEVHGASPPMSVAELHTAAQTVNADGDTVYRCQATQLPQAASPLRAADPRHFVADLRTRNVDKRLFFRGLLIVLFNKYQRRSQRWLPSRLRIRGGVPYPFIAGTGDGARTPTIGLLPGDLVEVRSREEIQATLGPNNCNGKLLFDAEMFEYCGRQARVAYRVSQIIDERTGKIIKLGDCVVLENVVCQGLYHRFCQRAITPYWREAWLRRVPQPASVDHAVEDSLSV
jgi:hypothetical protein